MADDNLSLPEWWDWELEFTPHLLKRMVDRSFNEVDVRSMLAAITDWRKSTTEGRYVVTSRFQRREWEAIVEPDETSKLLIVVTAYRRD